jgi:hypothetical protein
MSLNSRKAPTHFGTVTKSGKLTPAEAAAVMLVAGFPADPKVISEGLGTIDAESGFDAKNPGDGTHIGLWMEEPSFGSKADRLDPLKSTTAAYRRWKADGNSFNDGWTKWEHGEVEGTGVERAHKYLTVATAAAKSGVGNFPKGGGINPLEPAEDVIGAVESAEEFLQRALETILDFRALGNLAAQAFSWFIKLLAKAIWDYVIAPLFHWGERAVEFYWTNFFSTGTEQGSGFGYQLRNNAGAVTILFWSMGYAILWSDGTSGSPVAAHESLFGQGVKQVEGAIARRNLVKPGKVKEKTLKKPKPVETKVPIERRQTFSVARKRPVSVHSEGRNRASSQGFKSRPIPRPTQEQRQSPEQRQRLVLPPGIKPEQAQKPSQRPTKPSRPRVGA